jgi:hypothetical protein
MNRKHHFALLLLSVALLSFILQVTSFAQFPLRPPSGEKMGHDQGTIYFIKKSNPKILKIVEGKFFLNSLGFPADSLD